MLYLLWYTLQIEHFYIQRKKMSNYTFELAQEIYKFKTEGKSLRDIAQIVFGDRKDEYKVRRVLKRFSEELKEVAEGEEYPFTNDNNPNVESDDYGFTDDRIITETYQTKLVESNSKRENDSRDYVSFLESKVQKLQDTITVIRRDNRSSDRTINYLESIYNSIHDCLSNYTFTRVNRTPVQTKKGSRIGIIQLSDIHFGEVVKSVENPLASNIYSTAARLKKFINRALERFKNEDVSNVLLALTGDLINSDRRLDESTSNSAPRAHTAIIAVDILNQIIHDILDEGYKVTVSSVIGNESRVNKEVTWTKHTAADNYDYIIHSMLEMMFVGNDKVNFFEMDNVHESAITFVSKSNDNRYTLLLTHGNNTIASTNPVGEIQKLKGRYAATGVLVDYVIFGHIHSTYISNSFARSGSLVPGNGYSTNALNIGDSKASQNYYIVDVANKEIEATAIDLTYYDPEDMYFFDDVSYKKRKDSSILLD